MSREVVIFWAGRQKREEWETLCADYRRRIAHEIPIREQWIKVRQKGDDPHRRRAEGEALLAALPDPAWTIALDPRGRSRSSEAFAERLERRRQDWPHPIVFLIGSDLGLDEAVVDAARERLALGPMIFGHELARLVLYEQLYRAISISRGIKYHRPSF